MEIHVAFLCKHFWCFILDKTFLYSQHYSRRHNWVMIILDYSIERIENVKRNIVSHNIELFSLIYECQSFYYNCCSSKIIVNIFQLRFTTRISQENAMIMEEEKRRFCPIALSLVKARCAESHKKERKKIEPILTKQKENT